MQKNKKSSVPLGSIYLLSSLMATILWRWVVSLKNPESQFSVLVPDSLSVWEVLFGWTFVLMLALLLSALIVYFLDGSPYSKHGAITWGVAGLFSSVMAQGIKLLISWPEISRFLVDESAVNALHFLLKITIIPLSYLLASRLFNYRGFPSVQTNSLYK
jgi:hypothetical protein